MSILNAGKNAKKPRENALQAPASAQVNLIPGDLKGAQQESQINRWVALSVILALVLVGGWYWTAMQAANDAESKLDAATERQLQLNREKTQLSFVPRVFDHLANTEMAVGSAMSSEVLWRGYVDAMAAVIPDEASITSITLGTNLANLSVPRDGTQYLQPYVGFIQLNTRSIDLPNVQEWLVALRGVPGLVDVRLNTTSVTETDGTIYYETDVIANLDPQALANRFQPAGDDVGSEINEQNGGNE